MRNFIISVMLGGIGGFIMAESNSPVTFVFGVFVIFCGCISKYLFSEGDNR